MSWKVNQTHYAWISGRRNKKETHEGSKKYGLLVSGFRSGEGSGLKFLSLNELIQRAS